MYHFRFIRSLGLHLITISPNRSALEYSASKSLPIDWHLAAAAPHCGGRTMAYKVSGVSGIFIASRMEYSWLSWTRTAFTEGFEITRQPRAITLFERVPHQRSADPRALDHWQHAHHPTMPVRLIAHDSLVGFFNDRGCATKSPTRGIVHPQKGKR